ncbi:aminotransferase class IV [uncultured Thermanaerothrix sp.]|uniref:aminotransferase class IV n=1 Tax=uncultured Thermanaerothrix sp. TaxID=1195149 RepID=UPI0026082042|nr:aminotransferase class IV [uncultured Thermanaerothrix sp.]
MGMVSRWFLDFNTLQLQDLGPKEGTLDAITLEFPPGAYTTFRTYRGFHVLPLEPHFQRLEKTLCLQGYSIRLPRKAIRLGVYTAINPASNRGDYRVRLLVPVAENGLGCYIFVESLVVPADWLYKEGAWAVTRFLTREQPEAKSSQFIYQTVALREQDLKRHPRINEILMINAYGEILEGLSSNFFAVKKAQILTAGEGVLPGVTRSMVIDIARRAGFPILFCPLKINDIGTIDEAFITSSSRGVLPIVRIDENAIGNGYPGLITQAIASLYNLYIDRSLEPIYLME